jgi:hypothetical protein
MKIQNRDDIALQDLTPFRANALLRRTSTDLTESDLMAPCGLNGCRGSVVSSQR